MLVKTNGDGVLVVPLLNPGEAVTPGRERMVALVPGWNEIAKEDWPKAQAHLKDLIASGRVEIKGKEVDEEVEENGTKVTKTVVKDLSLAEIHATVARKIVEGCFNPKDLDRWKEDSKLSSELRGLVDIQLRKIEEVGKE